MRSDILFYVCDGTGSVFDSQVMALLQEVNTLNIFLKVFLILGIRDYAEKEDILKKYKNPGFEIVYYKTYPNYPIFNILNRVSLKKALSDLNYDRSRVIFHTRGEMSAWYLSEIIDKKYHHRIIPDVRGASVEEINEFYTSNKFLKYLKILNSRKAVKNLSIFKNISAVSGTLRKYLEENSLIESNVVSVIPCLAGSSFKYFENSRNQLRTDLGIKNDEVLIVFTSGGTASWQKNEIILKLAEKDFKVLNLSKRQINHQNIINKFVYYSDIHEYLNAADLAVIWRDKSMVNKVASPVKFSEYVCCGLPVVANKSVEMIVDYILKHNCGLLVDKLDQIELDSLKKLIHLDRKVISETAILNFGLSAITEKYLKLYSAVDAL